MDLQTLRQHQLAVADELAAATGEDHWQRKVLRNRGGADAVLYLCNAATPSQWRWLLTNGESLAKAFITYRDHHDAKCSLRWLLRKWPDTTKSLRRYLSYEILRHSSADVATTYLASFVSAIKDVTIEEPVVDGSPNKADATQCAADDSRAGDRAAGDGAWMSPIGLHIWWKAQT